MVCTQVSQHFPTALGVDDFISRMEIALRAYDFKDSNTIACCNLCRDEVTFILKQKLDAVRLLSLLSTTLASAANASARCMPRCIHHCQPQAGISYMH